MGPPGLQLLATAQSALATVSTEVPPDRRAFFAAMEMVDPAPDDLRAALADCTGAHGVDYERFYTRSWRQIHPLWLLTTLNNVGFCMVCARLHIHGDNAVLAAGDDAVVAALGEAFSTVRAGRADLALAGGVSPRLGPLGAARRRLQTAPMRPATAREGEGCAVMVLEPVESARDRGAEPLAIISGWGSVTARDDREGFAQAMETSLEAAGADPSSVQRVLTANGSPAERAAIATVVGCSSADHDELLPPGRAAMRIAAAIRTLGGVSPGEVNGRVLVNACGDAGQFASVLLEQVG